jgi:hypothetical protein
MEATQKACKIGEKPFGGTGNSARFPAIGWNGRTIAGVALQLFIFRLVATGLASLFPQEGVLTTLD